MGEIFTTLQANWAVIQQAPWIFGIWTVVVVSAAWAFVSHLKANTIETLEARLRLRDDRISEYERKLPAASPDQARALFDALEKKIEAMKPKAVQRNPNNLYQLGEAVATEAAGASTNNAAAAARIERFVRMTGPFTRTGALRGR